MLPLWDFLSLLVYALVAYPVIRYVETAMDIYLYIIIGCVASLVFVKITRMLPPIHPAMLRPKGARDFNILNKGGPEEGKVGMPSGHVLLSTFVVFSLLFMGGKITYMKAVFSVACLIAIGLSRVAKGCHTWPQIIAGFVFGVLFAFWLHASI